MKTIGIIGFGRFGQLLTKIMSDQLSEFEIKIFSRSHKPIRKNGRVSFVSKSQLSECDVIIPCVPISSFEEVIKKIKDIVKPGCLVIDVCSVKIFPVAVMEKFLPRSVNIIASHPLFGPDSAKNGIRGLRVVLWNVRTRQNIFNKTKKVIKRLGLEIIEISPEEHDKMIAFSQGFTHLIGRIAEQIHVKSTPIDTKSFQQFLSLKQIVINDSFELFLDMHRFNPFSTLMRKKFLQAFQKIERDIHE